MSVCVLTVVLCVVVAVHRQFKQGLDFCCKVWGFINFLEAVLKLFSDYFNWEQNEMVKKWKDSSFSFKPPPNLERLKKKVYSYLYLSVNRSAVVYDPWQSPLSHCLKQNIHLVCLTGTGLLSPHLVQEVNPNKSTNFVFVFMWSAFHFFFFFFSSKFQSLVSWGTISGIRHTKHCLVSQLPWRLPYLHWCNCMHQHLCAR